MEADKKTQKYFQKRRERLEKAIERCLLEHKLVVPGTKVILGGDYSYGVVGGTNETVWEGRYRIDESKIGGQFKATFKPKDPRFYYIFHKPAYDLRIEFNGKNYEKSFPR